MSASEEQKEDSATLDDSEKEPKVEQPKKLVAKNTLPPSSSKSINRGPKTTQYSSIRK